jgi:hypothetical protein
MPGGESEERAMTETTASVRSLGPVDRGLYALFSRHADRPAHERDRQRYRGAGLSTSFDVYLARVYGVAWAVAGVSATGVFVGTVLLPSWLVAAVLDFLGAGLPVVNRLPALPVPPVYLAAVLAAATGATVRWG